MSKLFTSIVVMQQVEAGRVELDAPVARYLPEFSEHSAASPYDKSGVTVRQLLTHTSGFPAFLPLWRDYPDPASRLRAAVTADLTAEAGTRYLYSDLNLITLGALVSTVSGKSLDALVAEGITRPLRMRDTGYNPTARADGTGSPPPSSRPSPTGGWCGARCTTRTPGRSAGWPGTPASSPPPAISASWRRP